MSSDDLAEALAGLAPELDPETYVFVSLPRLRPELGAVASIREAEGVTHVVSRNIATREALSGSFPCRRITLSINTALDLVGLLARVASLLAEEGIPCNAVAGLHHDHLFVPIDLAGRALAALGTLAGAEAADAPR